MHQRFAYDNPINNENDNDKNADVFLVFFKYSLCALNSRYIAVE